MESDEQRHARTGLSSIEVTDAESKAVQQTPNRISLDYLMGEIVSEEYIRPQNIPHMTVLVAILRNGFAVVGNSTPADPANYNEELGRKFAKEDCIRQMWRLYGFALREKLSQGG